MLINKNAITLTIASTFKICIVLSVIFYFWIETKTLKPYHNKSYEKKTDTSKW